MKIKSTNNVQNRRNIRKRKIGSIVTGALIHRNEASLENLAGHVSRRLNRTMAQIYPAVNRTLNCGVRDGFITKHGNKYSLSSKRNYETDFVHPDEIVRAAMDEKLNGSDVGAFNLCTGRRENTGCEFNSPGTRCRAIDLISLEQCNYKRHNSHYCDLHQRVELIFRYMRLYFQNIVEILNMYHDQGISFFGEMTYMMDLVQRLKADRINTTNAAEIYVRFLERFARFIRNQGGQPPDNELENLLRGVQTGNQIPPQFINIFTCFATDLESGGICLNNNGGVSDHCATHERWRIFNKLFMHSDEPGDGLHRDTVEHVLRRFPLFTQAEEQQLIELPTCSRLYMSLAIRLANHAILQHWGGHSAEHFVTVAIETKKINNWALSRFYCLCKCIGDIACERLFEITDNVIANQTFQMPE